MKMNRIFVLLLITAILISSIPVSVLAADDNSSSYDRTISVTVPSKISITIDEKGRINVKDDEFDIDNDSEFGVTVRSVDVTGINDWEVVPYADSMKNYEDEEKVIAFSFNGKGTKSNGKVNLRRDDWFIPVNRSLGIDMNVKFPRQDIMPKTEIAVIDWSFSLVSGKEKVTIKTGNNGKVDKTNVYTDSNGRIREFPEPIPNAGYLFDHWEGPDGDVINSDYVFTTTPEITPIFIKGYTIFVEESEGGKITSNYKKYYTNTEYTLTKLPTCEPDKNYKFIRWEDSHGNEVKVGDTLTSDLYIHPVFDTTVKIGFDIKFNESENCTISSTKTIRTGADNKVPQLPNVTCKDSYVFKGWQDESGKIITEGMILTSDVTLTPVTAYITSFLIEFEDTEYGKISSLDKLRTSNDGIVPVLPSVTPYDGWIFNGWYNSSDQKIEAGMKITNNIKLKAKFTKDQTTKFKITVVTGDTPCPVTFNKTEVYTDTSGKITELPVAAVASGYTFLGFIDNDNTKLNVGDTIIGNVAVTPAIKSPDSGDVTIAFETDGNGTISSSTVLQVPYGATLGELGTKLPTTSSASAIFSHWSFSNKKITDSHMFLKDEIIRANFNSYFMFSLDGYVLGFSDAYNSLTTKPKSVSIPDSINGVTIKYIGDSAFQETFVDSINLPTTLITIGKDAFKNSKATSITSTGGGGVEIINEGAFYGCKITSINLGTALISIGKEAFAKSNVSSVTFPSTLRELGEGAFRETKLTSISFSDSISYVPKYLCYNCAELASVTFTNHTQAVDAFAFGNCDKLTNISLPDSMQTFDVSNINRNLTNFTINDGCELTHDGTYKTSNTKVKNSLVFKFSAKTIQSLMDSKEITLWSNVEIKGVGDIPSSFLSGCSNLQSLTVPDTTANRREAPFGSTLSKDNITFKEVS